MSMAMTVREREDFLAAVHVAVVTVADDGDRGPLAIPLWYDYRPGGQISLITERDSRKTALIRRAGRVTLCVQTVDLPYRYATVEGPVTAIDESVTLDQRRDLARRYLGPEGAEAYLASTPGATERMVMIHIRPENWLTRDFGKAVLSGQR